MDKKRNGVPFGTIVAEFRRVNAGLWFCLIFSFFLVPVCAVGSIAEPEPIRVTIFECLPPRPFKDFQTHLSFSRLELAVHWFDLLNWRPDPSHRLIFQQLVTEDVSGRIVFARNQKMMSWSAIGLTATPWQLQHGELQRSPFHERLFEVNKKYHLFIVDDPRLPSRHPGRFEAVVKNGTSIFTRERHAIVMSADRTAFSLCTRLEESYGDALVDSIKPVPNDLFDLRDLSAFFFQFLQDRPVIELLKCEEWLINRK